jgi:hypothetical protein
MNAITCRHCERRPAVSAWGLCERCDRTRGVRLLYLYHRGRTPADEAILDRLRQRANAGLPLFPRSAD